MWRYPRAAVAAPSDRHIRIEHHGVLVALSHAADGCFRESAEGRSNASNWVVPGRYDNRLHKHHYRLDDVIPGGPLTRG